MKQKNNKIKLVAKCCYVPAYIHAGLMNNLSDYSLRPIRKELAPREFGAIRYVPIKSYLIPSVS